MLKKFYHRHRARWDQLDQFLLGNPVLERGLVLAPIVVACTSVQNALLLSAAFSAITILTVFLTYFIPKKLPYTIRVIANAAIASLIFVPVYHILQKYWPEIVYNVGIYLPLIATNSLIVQKSESRYHRQKIPVMLVQLFTASIGFSAVAVMIGAVRELFGKGMLMGTPVKIIRFTAPALLLPCCGFILLGFLAAVLQKYRLHLEKPLRKPPHKENRHE